MNLDAKLNDVAQFIKAKRKQLGYSQKDLADVAHVSVQIVRDLEHGKMDLKLEKVERVLNAVGYKISTAKMDKR